jgi:hypothetical protein
MYILYMNRDDYVMMSVEELNTELTKLRNSSPKLVHLIKKLIEYKDSTQVLSDEPQRLLNLLKIQQGLYRDTGQYHLPIKLRNSYRDATQSGGMRKSKKSRKHGKSKKHRKSRRR